MVCASESHDYSSFEKVVGKLQATTPEGIVGGLSSLFFKGEAMDVCLRVLKESNKGRVDS